MRRGRVAASTLHERKTPRTYYSGAVERYKLAAVTSAFALMWLERYLFIENMVTDLLGNTLLSSSSTMILRLSLGFWSSCALTYSHTPFTTCVHDISLEPTTAASSGLKTQICGIGIGAQDERTSAGQMGLEHASALARASAEAASAFMLPDPLAREATACDGINSHAPAC